MSLQEQPPFREAGPKLSRRGVPARPRVAGIAISHPERVVYPAAGGAADIRKLEVARYYEGIARAMLPYVRNRPLSVVRCPEEAGGECFYQRHPAGHAIPGVESASIDTGEGSGLYLIANTRRALVGLAQMGAIELHGWGATLDDIERPDVMVLDLDPDPGLGWHTVIGAAQLVHDVLQDAGLASYVKTTGGKGLHVVVPLARGNGWDEVLSFAHALAAHIAEAAPERFTATAGKAKRTGKIYIDYLRNARGATAIAPFSLRARGQPTVAMPLTWKALALSVHADAYTLSAVLARPKRTPDPWSGYAGARQSITPGMLKRFKA